MGEASHPGPILSVITANVTSLIPHIPYVANLEADVLALQEVRLTTDGQKLANDLLEPFKLNSVWGKAQPIRRGTRLSTLDAKQGGVGVLHRQQHSVSPSPRTEVGQALFETGRWQSVAVNFNGSGLIFHVVSLYGYAGANEGGELMETNENFLNNVFAEASSFGDIPVLVVGDFNVKIENSPILTGAVSNGEWTDVGYTHAILQEQEPENTHTARGVSSRIDMVFANPEALRYLTSFRVLPVPSDGIKNHLPIRLEFEVICPRATALKTRKIRGLPSERNQMTEDEINLLADDVLERCVEEFFEAVDSANVDKVWSSWSNIAETFLLERVAMESGIQEVAYRSAYRGRGHAACTHSVRLGKIGDVHEGVKMDPEQRAVIKVHRLLGEILSLPEFAHNGLVHELWGKVCRIGKEFLQCQPFTPFWTQTYVPELFELMTLQTEVYRKIEIIVTGGRRRTVRRWQTQLNQAAKNDIGKIYKHFRPIEQSPLTFLKRDDNTLTGNVREMDEILRSKWGNIFAKHENRARPFPDADQFFERYNHLIPHFPQELQKLNAEDIRKTISSLDSSGAGGLDGWKPAEIKLLPAKITNLLLHMFDLVESEGKWPSDLCWAGITLIPKGEGGDPLSLRPITVTPIVYRIWAASRMRHSLSWQDKWMERGQHGARSKHSTTDALTKISLEFERAMLHNTPMFGVAVDLAKAFDNIPVEITFRLFEKLGIDSGLCTALRGMYTQLQRRFKIGAFVGESFRSTNGILQGCPLSVMLLNALMMVLHRVIQPHVMAESFVDDLTMLHQDVPELQTALDLLDEFMRATDQEVNASKTKGFGLKSEPHLAFRGAPLINTSAVKILGMTWKFTDGHMELRMEDRKVQSLCELAHRIRCSGLTFELRKLLLGSLVMSKFNYAIELIDITAEQERRMRTAIGYAVWKKTDKSRNPGLLFTLVCKGHVIDPGQAPHVRRLNTFHRLLKIDPTLGDTIGELWNQKAPQRRLRRGGFVENLLYTTKRLGIHVDPEERVMTIGTTQLNWFTTSKREWSHDARDAARRAVWRQVDKERRRDDIGLGISNGILRDKTMLYYSNCGYRIQGILRKILLGAVWTRSRLAKLRDPPCTENCPCGAPKETLEHLWWYCPRWNDCRVPFDEYLTLIDLTEQPRATLELGLITPETDLRIGRWTHVMMVNIFSRRFEGM